MFFYKFLKFSIMSKGMTKNHATPDPGKQTHAHIQDLKIGSR